MKNNMKKISSKTSNKKTVQDIPFKSLGNLRKDTGHTTIYIGNLSYKRTNESIKTLFQKFGGVSYANIIFDKQTEKSKGFGFVQMKSASAARKAILELNGSLLDNRTIKVSIAVESNIEENTEAPKEKSKISQHLPEVATTKPRRKREKGLSVLFNFLGKS